MLMYDCYPNYCQLETIFSELKIVYPYFPQTMNMTMEMNMLETTVRSEEEVKEDEINLRR